MTTPVRPHTPNGDRTSKLGRQKVAEAVLLAWVVVTFAAYMVQFGPIIRIIATKVFPW